MKIFPNTPSVEIMIKCITCSDSHLRNIIAPLVYDSDMTNDEIDPTKLDDLSMVTACRKEKCDGKRETSISSLGKLIH